jgi:signal transduction histidine kinase
MRERESNILFDPGFRARTETILQEGQLLVAHMLERDYAGDILSLKKSLVVMNDFSRSTSRDRTTETLAESLDRALGGTQINYAALTMPEDKNETGTLPGKSSLYYLYRATRTEGSLTEPESFPTLSILPDHSFPEGNPMICNILPLADSGVFLGFVFFDASHPDSSIYELFRSQISGNLGRVKLLEALLEKETRERVEAEKMDALGTLVAGIAHEINTPIGICVTAASHLDRILDDLKKAFDASHITRSGMEDFLSDGTETGRLLSSNLARSSALISSFKKVAVDSSSEEHRFFAVREYINDILATLSPRLKHTEVKITVDCPDNLEIDSYPGAFSQILSNLVINSLEHGFDKPAKGNIKIRFNLTGENLVWKYEDDGKGIPPDILPRVFEPFFTTSRATGGSGLGLHIVYNTVTALFSGHISLSSVLSQGVKFTITIPLKQKEIRYAGTK